NNAQLQQLTDKEDFKEAVKLASECIKLIKEEASIHKNIIYAYCLKQSLSFITDNENHKQKSLMLTNKIKYIDTLIQKIVETEYAIYNTINPKILFIKTLSIMNLDKRILRAYLPHVSSNNAPLYSSLQNHIKNINSIKADGKNNMNLFSNVSIIQTNSLQSIISGIIELQKYLPVELPIRSSEESPMESIATPTTEYYKSIINALLYYITMLNNSTLDTAFFDLELFIQLHTSYSRLNDLLTIDKTNQQIVSMIKIHTNKINEMLNVCISSYVNLFEQGFTLNDIKRCIQALFETDNNNLQPYATKVLKEINIRAQKKTCPEKANNIMPYQKENLNKQSDNAVPSIEISTVPNNLPLKTVSWAFINILALPWIAIKALFNYLIFWI